jgi:uncharacterized protein (DUF1810 family)
MSDEHDLSRFLEAQRGSYAEALAEIRSGAKRSHWMWFLFPQIAGLGHSPMAQRYAIRDEAEAIAYLAHPVLGARLREITAALEKISVPDADRVFGGTDTMKLRSSLTLFAYVDPDPDALFARALDRWFGGETDKSTLERL